MDEEHCTDKSHAPKQVVKAPGVVWCPICNLPVRSIRPGGPKHFTADVAEGFGTGERIS